MKNCLQSMLGSLLYAMHGQRYICNVTGQSNLSALADSPHLAPRQTQQNKKSDSADWVLRCLIFSELVFYFLFSELESRTIKATIKLSQGIHRTILQCPTDITIPSQERTGALSVVGTGRQKRLLGRTVCIKRPPVTIEITESVQNIGIYLYEILK